MNSAYFSVEFTLCCTKNRLVLKFQISLPMNKNVYLLLIIAWVFLTGPMFGQSIQERLGYTKDAKLLIVHADDLGVSHSENAASFEGMERGCINSASILVPTPWLTEVAAYAKEHPRADLGIHVCMTSEWATFKWGSIADPSKVSSLLNEAGYFHDNSPEFAKHAKAEEVAMEVRAQIDRALAMGIKPTHLDAHMGAVYMRGDLLKELLKLSKEYDIPIAATKERLKAALPDLETQDMILVDKMYGAGPANYTSGMADFYANILENLDAGLHCIIIHAAYDDAEMQAVTVGKVPWGAHWRQEDFDFFTSERCRQILKKENIQLINWREIQEKLAKD